jgi:serine/threonine-protein kinase
MKEAHDPNRTVDIPSVPSDSLDAGIAAGFGRAEPRRSSHGAMRPVLLKEAEGESADVVKPKSDAMPPLEQTGDRYQLQGEIARGGMGAVLRGRDVDLGRDLAVKVLLEKHVHRPEVARRFIEEAQIGGQLQHPGVVPVYDIGRFGDRPFFTMKLVKGQTLLALLAERADASVDRPRYLAIALQVAQTLAYAHAKGVIHRDLKPANIMVGAFGEVQVMDWGLAKVQAEGGVADEEKASRERERPEDVTTIRTARSTGSTGSSGTDTEGGSLLGTPAYMPPEQANGDIANLDRRADVFGLGAILCEILTSKPPYVGRSSEEVRRKACNGDLADAIARLDACGADAELVGLTRTCLPAEAIDRPKDAQAVADGLMSYLNGVQERLHQAELAEAEAKAKAAEEAKRRRLTLVLAVTVLLALTLGGGGWLWVKDDRDARIARVTRDVNEALNNATALGERAKGAATGGPALFAQAREQAQRALALVENGAADAALRDQVHHLKAELDQEENDRVLVAALDEARLAQAETLSQNRFAPERAVPKFREAFAAYGLAAGEGEPRAVGERIRQRPAAIREAIVAALDEWDDLEGNPKYKLSEPHREWLRAVLAAAEPDDAWGRQVRAARAEKDDAKRRAALEKLAAAVDVTKVPARVLTRLAQQLAPAPRMALLRRAQEQHPADFWVNADLAWALLKAASPERDRMGQIEPHNLLAVPADKVSRPEWTEAVRFLTAAIALRPDSAGAHLNLGLAMEGNGRLDEAIACFQKAIELDPKYAIAHNNLGGALELKGQRDAAVVSLKKAIELEPNNAFLYVNLVNVLRKKGQVDDGIAMYRKAIELGLKDARTSISVGVELGKQGQLDEAIACLQNATKLAPKSAEGHFSLGVALQYKGQVDAAIASYKEAIAIDPKDAKSHSSLGVALQYKGQVDAAIASYKEAIAIDPKDAKSHSNLGVALKEKGRLDEAISSWRKAIEVDPKLAQARANLGHALLDKGQLDEAIANYKKLIELSPNNATAHYNLGRALGKKDQLDEAMASYNKAIELKPDFAEAHCNLGSVLKEQARFAESLEAYKRGHELGTKRPGWRYPSAQWLREAESTAAMDSKLTAFLKGDFQPRSTADRLGLIGVCQVKKLHAAAARLYADAFAADPKLADEPQRYHRYNAASSAAMAAAGQLEGAARLDAKEKASFRKQALDWLRAELAMRAKQLESGQPGDRATAQFVLRRWQQNKDFAAISDEAALAKLPAEERAAWESLSTDVAAVLKKRVDKR